jgi:hypothetical protein
VSILAKNYEKSVEKNFQGKNLKKYYLGVGKNMK